MKTQKTPADYSRPKAQAEDDTINTQKLRALLGRVADALASISIEKYPDRAAKLTIQMINLTKTIRETETYNHKLLAPFKDKAGQDGATLEERLEGYAPTPDELEAFEAELKDRLMVLGPRLFEEGSE